MKKNILAIIFIFLATVALAGPPAIPPSGSSISAYTDITGLWTGDGGLLNSDGSYKVIGTDVPGVYDTPTDGQLVKWKNDSGAWKLESAGAPVVIDEGTSTGDALIKTSTGVGKATWLIDAHAASTTITLYAGTCPMITNASQAAEDVNNTLPAVGAGKCFVALATTAQASNYWRLTAAAANTVCLNRTCGKDYIEFSTPAVGDTFACMSDGTSWYCYDRDSDATAGDL